MRHSVTFIGSFIVLFSEIPFCIILVLSTISICLTYLRVYIHKVVIGMWQFVIIPCNILPIIISFILFRFPPTVTPVVVFIAKT